MNIATASVQSGSTIIVPSLSGMVQPYAGFEVTLLGKMQGVRRASGSVYDVWEADFEGTPARVYLSQAGSVRVVAES